MKISFGFETARNTHLASLVAFCQCLLSEIMGVLFIPSQDLNSLEQTGEFGEEKLDEVSSQWELLWSCIGRQLTPHYPCKHKTVVQSTSEEVVVELRALRRSLLSHASNDASSSQMLACYRNAGEPAADAAVSCLFLRNTTLFNKTNLKKLKKHSLQHRGCAFFISCYYSLIKKVRKEVCILYVLLRARRVLPIPIWLPSHWKILVSL